MDIHAQFSRNDSRLIHNLSPWELNMLSKDYSQGGFLFPKPPIPINIVIDRLRDSLSRVLSHFPTLTGRLVTRRHKSFYTVELDCTRPQGVKFTHAATDLRILDVFSPNQDLPDIFQSFLPFTGAINHDGHTKPLFAVQVTTLADGIFIGFNINHCVADGTSLTHFNSTWAAICKGNGSINQQSIPLPPITQPVNQIIHLPYSTQVKFAKRKRNPPLRVRMFHFSSNSIARLKAKANAEANTNKISPFQALNAFVWRSMTQARNLALDQETSCKMVINDRLRMRPALPVNYFGNGIRVASASTTAGELLGNNLGWSAWLLHVAIESHTNDKIQTWAEEWIKNPRLLRLEEISDVPTMIMQGSPRFDGYAIDFGWGKPLALRSGQNQKLDGNVMAYAAREEKGSIDLEISLSPESMSALLLDHEFMGVVSPQFLFGTSRI